MARMVLVEAGTNCAAGSTEAAILEGVIQMLLVVRRDVGTIAAVVVGAVRFTTWLHFGSCSIIHC